MTATRYSNKLVGYNIGFEFPKNPNDCDREELFKFIEVNGGNVYEGGGSPGATLYATFVGVTDRTSADKKLLELLPAFDALMDDIYAGRKIKPLTNTSYK